jgi:hypothetical protein
MFMSKTNYLILTRFFNWISPRTGFELEKRPGSVSIQESNECKAANYNSDNGNGQFPFRRFHCSGLRGR